MNEEDASRRLVEQQRKCSADVHIAHAEMSTNRDVPHPQEDNELTIVDVRMTKEVIPTDIGRGMMEVVQRVNVESNDVIEAKNEEGHGRSWKSAEMDESEGEVRTEGSMWGRWRRVRGARARGKEEISVDVHANCTGADRVRGGTMKGPKKVVCMHARMTTEVKILMCM